MLFKFMYGKVGGWDFRPLSPTSSLTKLYSFYSKGKITLFSHFKLKVFVEIFKNNIVQKKIYYILQSKLIMCSVVDSSGSQI